MPKPMTILVFIKRFDLSIPKHQQKFLFILAMQKYANILLWHEDGHIETILKQLDETPDFIFHYDIAWRNAMAPNITGLDKISIPKSSLIIDLHFDPAKREAYIYDNKIDLIFSICKEAFFKTFPYLKEKFRWLPWSIDSCVYRDWGLEKEYDYLLMGLVNTGEDRVPPKGKYLFRDHVYSCLKDDPRFTFHRHPGHRSDGKGEGQFLNERFAKELNKSKIFFTCGSVLGYPVQKFFEVPACRSLLLAEPNKDILELGFTDQINFVACTNKDFEEKAAYYLENEKERTRIANAGYQLVHSQHTHEIRAQQLINTLSAYLN